MQPETVITPEPPKKLVIYNIPGGAMWAIKFEGGGFTPLPLRGQYTSYDFAQLAIDRYYLARD